MLILRFGPARTVIIVAARELREHARSPLVWLLVLVAAGLASASSCVSLKRLSTAEAQVRQLTEQREQDRGRNAGRLFGAQTESGLRAIRPAEPLSVLVHGLDEEMPRFWDVSPSGVLTGRVAGTLPSGPSGEIDLEFLIRVVFGLLAVSLAVESIAGERTSGALLALLGQSIGRQPVLAGKVLGGLGVLAAAVIVVAGTAAGTTAAAAPHLISADYLASVLLLIVAGIVYTMTCFAGGLLLSSVFPSYRVALMTTLVVWTVSAMIGSPATGIIAEALAPVPARSLLEANRQRLVVEATTAIQNRLGDEFVKALAGTGDWRRREADPAARRMAQARTDALWDQHVTRTRTAIDTINRALDDALRRQASVSRLLEIANPASLFAAAAANLAGTGRRSARKWETATAAYQRSVERVLFDNRARYYAHVAYADDPQPGGASRLVVSLDRRPLLSVSEVPAFEPPSRSLAVRVRDATPNLLLLSMYAGGLLLASMFAFSRLRV